ncbi:MAG: GerMN domain-containing protein [Acidimicrobiales bacterium]
MSRSRRPRSRAALVALSLLLVLSGCGVQSDGEPRVIAADELPDDLVDANPTTSAPISGSTSAATIYLLVRSGDTTRLAPVERKVADPSEPGERIDALLMATTADEQEQGFVSSIPTDTVLLGTELNETTEELVVDLSGALFDVQGTELANAFAQIVWTVTAIDGVRQVRFRVDGEPYRAPNAEGIEQDGAVTTADYQELAPIP